MWPIPELSNELVTIVLNHDSLILSWIQPVKNTSSYFQLNAYQNVQLMSFDFERGIINNPSNLKKYIDQFLSTHKIKHASVGIAVSSPAVYERIITIGQATPSKNDLADFESNMHIIESIYLYAQENMFTFYTCAIKREQLLQFQSLAVATKLNLSSITTQNAACLQLYSFIKGNHFLHTQLGFDLDKSQNDIPNLISATQVGCYLKINELQRINIAQESHHLKSSLGLAISHFA
jgi:hypothetical protein